MENQKDPNLIELQYQELLKKARELYPDTDESITTLHNMIAQTNNLQEFLNLYTQLPTEITNNYIPLSLCQHGDNFSVK